MSAALLFCQMRAMVLMPVHEYLAAIAAGSHTRLNRFVRW